MKIVTDCIARISSNNILKQNVGHVLKKVDKDGKLVSNFGAKGRSVEYEDTCNLNFRKKEVWDMIINDTLYFIERYQIHGIHLDEAS